MATEYSALELVNRTILQMDGKNIDKYIFRFIESF